MSGGVLVEDPYPQFAELRAASPVHKGSVAQLLGLPESQLMRSDAPSYSAF